MMDFIFAGLGLVILVLAGDALVRGAVGVSLRLGVPAFIVSLTIVAIGTSAPELLIGVSAMLEGAPGIAIGNVVGSNTANILLVLGVPALLAGLHTSKCETRASYVQMMVASVFFLGVAATGAINWIVGMVMLAAFMFIMAQAVREARQHMTASDVDMPEDTVDGESGDTGWGRILFFLGLGVVGLPLGADLLVTSASEIARHYDVPETVIGLTLVAVGTSLPELATTVSAAVRRQADVALGNVIGSNIANILAILGVTSLFGTIPVPPEMLRFDIPVMLLSSLLIAPFVFMRMDIGRIWGLIFFAAYIVYAVVVLV